MSYKSPNKRRDYNLRWRAENLELAREIGRQNQRRRRDLNPEGERERLRRWFLNNPDRDHVVPLSKGGEHSEDNLVPACAPCNLSKGNKTGAAFNRWRRQNGRST